MISRCSGFKSAARSCLQCLRKLPDVARISSLAASFNSVKTADKLSLRLRRPGVGLFCIPELYEPAGFHLLQNKLRDRVDDLLEEAVSSTRQRKMVQIFDDLSDALCRVADMSDFVRLAHPDVRYAAAAEETCTAVGSLVEKLNTNVELYQALKNVVGGDDVVPVDAVDQRVASLFLVDFDSSGIHLPETKRKEFVELTERIATVGNLFQQGCHQSVAISKNELPTHLRSVMFGPSSDSEQMTISGLYSDSPTEAVREASYRTFLCSEGEDAARQARLLDTLLALRGRLARLAGYETYAHRAVGSESLLGSPAAVLEFLHSLSAGTLRELARADYELLTSIKRQAVADQSASLKPWDITYCAAVTRHQRFAVDHNSLLPYFSLGACMEGLSQLFRRLYGVQLHCRDPEYGELWHPSVYKLEVAHETDGILGHIYCDFFERAGKPHQDCHFTIRGGRQLQNGSYQSPVVVLMMNFTEPPPGRGGMPPLLSMQNVENLFHEFGHAMHSMLGRTRYQHVTGTRCSTDFAEVPSVLMEYFANDPRVISTFAYHYETGEPLPKSLALSACKSRAAFAASDIQLQVFYSLLDQVYHGRQPLSKTTTAILAELQNEHYGLPYVKETAWQLRFSHLVGYGAKYYSYLVSRAVASSIWRKCFVKDPFDRDMGNKYRHELLAHGGGKAPSELIENLVGEQPTVDFLVKSLLHDIEGSAAATCS